jgi:hypothetical protein
MMIIKNREFNSLFFIYSFMKYLRRFESKSNDIKEVIEDILLPIKDLNLRVNVRLEQDEYSIIVIRIEPIDTSDRRGFYWSDIEDDFLRVIDYTKGQYVPGDVYYKEIQPDGRIFNKNTRDNLPLSSFIKYNTKNKLYTLSIMLFEYVEYSKDWYRQL